MDARELHDLAETLFKKKASLNSLHQEIAEHFFVERANFTTSRYLGEDFAANLITSYPILCRRDLGNQFSTMLRPTAKRWFHIRRKHTLDEDNETKQWLQAFEETQWRAMYDSASKFTRATKEGDHDFATFGQCCISIELNRTKDGLLYRNWHLKDMCWQENENGDIGARFRKWKPTVQQLMRLFPGKVHRQIEEASNQSSRLYEECNIMHMVVEADMYDGDAKGMPWWSVYYDCANQHVMEAMPMWNGYYIIPRWQTVSGSQYAYSPATVAALPDARLIQAMTYSLLEAGEKASNPPLIATQDAVRSDVAVYAGGVTWVSEEYDERLGEALRPITQDIRGFPFGVQMAQDSRAIIREAFFLNQLGLPDRASGMTPYEISQRIQQYIRNALPLFEPVEHEYNAAVCEQTFDILWRNGAFGPPQSWPKKLRGADIDFHFESPLHDAIEQQKGQKFLEAKEMLAVAAAIDQSVVAIPKTEVALRDVLNGLGVPAKWLRSEQEVEEIRQKQQQEAEAQKMLAAMQQAGQAAASIGQAQLSSAQAGQVEQQTAGVV